MEQQNNEPTLKNKPSDDTLIFEMDDHVEVVYEYHPQETFEDQSIEKTVLNLSSSLPIQTPSIPKWRSELENPTNTFVAPHIQSLKSSKVISGSLPSSRRSKLNMI